MKAMIWILVLAGAGIGAAYYFGGLGNFDPTQQGKDARAKLAPGMTLKQVLDVAGENYKYQQINMMPQMIGGKKIEMPSTGTAVSLERDALEKKVAAGGVPNGFVLNYTFSAQQAFNVHFDSTGKVDSIEDAFTEADLYQSH